MSFSKNINANWLNPPALFRSAPFWSWNAKLDPDRLCRQIDSMNNAGMGGFFMHSRYGLKTEYLGDEWFECVSACVEKSRETGMKAYLYDEDRWPSGATGGKIVEDNPDFNMRYLAAAKSGVMPTDIDHYEKRIAAFEIELNKDGKLVSYTRCADDNAEGENVFCFDQRKEAKSPLMNDSAYADTMNPDAMKAYIESSHQVYADKYGKDFGGVIPATFTDEPNFGYFQNYGVHGEEFHMIWTPLVIDAFKEKWGYDLIDHLPELVFQSVNSDYSKARYDYLRTLTELFVVNYSKQIGDWCEENNIPLTGHVLLEGTMKDQITAVGSCMQHYEHMQWPGIDLLMDQSGELITAKQCSSVADQLGKERSLTELYGCTGWDWPLEGHKFMADWQMVCGINFMCPHLSHYSLEGGAKRDYPASIIDHSPWWKYYNTVQDYLGRVCYMITQGTPRRDVLVIHTVESLWGSHCLGEDFDASVAKSLDDDMKTVIYGLMANHFDFDFADEALLAKYGKVDDDVISVGQMEYKTVVVPSSVTLRSSTVDSLETFVAAGGSVVFAGRVPTLIDSADSERLAQLVTNSASSALDGFISNVEGTTPRRVSILEDGKELECVWSMLREVDGGNLLFIQSHDRENGHDAKIKIAQTNGDVILWDTITGEKIQVESVNNDGVVEFDLKLHSSGSAMVTIGVACDGVCAASVEVAPSATKKIAGDFEIELTEDNSLPLDYCRYKFEGEQVSDLVPVLKASELIRAKFGLKPQLGIEQQPWFLLSRGLVDPTSKGKLEMHFSFNVTNKSEKCQLVVEHPENFTITVNGTVVDKVTGFWIDEDFETIDIASLVKEGNNEIVLDFDYTTNLELDAMYLIGDFGVKKITDSEPISPTNVTLVAQPSKLSLGSWVGQNLDFYTGGVNYKMNFGYAGDEKIKISLPGVSCTAAAVHVNGKTVVLPWAPFSVDVTESLKEGNNEIVVEVIGGRKNILGPLHTPKFLWTGPDQFDPNNEAWENNFFLTDHGLMEPIKIEYFG